MTPASSRPTRCNMGPWTGMPKPIASSVHALALIGLTGTAVEQEWLTCDRPVSTTWVSMTYGIPAVLPKAWPKHCSACPSNNAWKRWA